MADGQTLGRVDAATVRVGLVGAGKFGAMFLTQAPTTPGLAVAAIVDLNLDHARKTCESVGWDADRTDRVGFYSDIETMLERESLDVIVEATGDPIAGVAHARAAFRHRVHIVMANVEADVLVGPVLAQEAAAAGVVYSMAYGDQPALICELVDWARSCGFTVVAAGKGTKYLPEYHAATPDTVWGHYGLSAAAAAEAGMNAKMFNSFLDGTKSAIEMAAVANATGLAAPADGLAFPPVGADDLVRQLIPKRDGGVLAGSGMVEVVSSLTRDRGPVERDLRWGVYVVFAAETDYARACFRQYGVETDPSGRYAALYRPFHLIGMELNVSVFAAARQGRPTGTTRAFTADVVAIAKRDLAPGDKLDGEGGYCAWGKLSPARKAQALDGLPIGLTQGAMVRAPIRTGSVIRWSDVELDESAEAVQLRRAMTASDVTGH